MKGSWVAAAAALAGGASADRAHRAAHELFHNKRGGETCTPGCTTIYTTVTKEPEWIPCTSSAAPTVPSPIGYVCPTPGTYSYPESTMTIADTATVCLTTTTKVTQGTYTLGGVTTTVSEATTITCPYATYSKKPEGYVTRVIETTTYVCPSAGTYTIAPHTTTVTCASETEIEVPVVTEYPPGTYTAPAVTTTVTDTSAVVYCPYTTPTPTPTPTSSATPEPSGYPHGTNGKKWAITYTPYHKDGSCKSASEVMNDLTGIKGAGFTTVRVYSTDCGALPNVGNACRSLGMRMMAGVFVGEVGCDNASPDVQAQIHAIKDWAQWDLVELIVVGNEAGHNNYCTPGQLKALIVEMKQILVECGQSIPVTTSDTVDVWQRPDFAAEICPVVDIVACNSHAYFNAGTPAEGAGEFVKGQLEIVKAICGKPGYVLETGWPSYGKQNGAARCSKADQAKAIASLQVYGDEFTMFSYQDDPWKTPGECQCEQNWGCGYLFGLPM